MVNSFSDIMKIHQLFEIRYSPRNPDGSIKPTYNGSPRYSSEVQTKYSDDGNPRKYTRTGIISGFVGDWLDEMGVSRKDIPEAMEQAKKSDEYKNLLRIGFEDVTSKPAKANGTFVFRGARGSLLDDYSGDVVIRRVLANGRITSVSTYQDGTPTSYTGRLKSEQPALAATHSHLTPVERLVSNYTRAFARIYKVQQPKFKKALRNRLGEK